MNICIIVFVRGLLQYRFNKFLPKIAFKFKNVAACIKYNNVVNKCQVPWNNILNFQPFNDDRYSSFNYLN